MFDYVLIMTLFRIRATSFRDNVNWQSIMIRLHDVPFVHLQVQQLYEKRTTDGQRTVCALIKLTNCRLSNSSNCQGRFLSRCLANIFYLPTNYLDFIRQLIALVFEERHINWLNWSKSSSIPTEHLQTFTASMLIWRSLFKLSNFLFIYGKPSPFQRF